MPLGEKKITGRDGSGISNVKCFPGITHTLKNAYSSYQEIASSHLFFCQINIFLPLFSSPSLPNPLIASPLLYVVAFTYFFNKAHSLMLNIIGKIFALLKLMKL